MPVRIANLNADTATATLQVGDETLNIVYRPGGLTPEVEDQIHALAQEQRGSASLVVLLRDILISWDLLGNDGQPLPTDEATLRTLPSLFLGQVAQAISESMSPNRRSAGPSGAGWQLKGE